MSARLIWLAIRGWHVFAKEDVPMADVVAVILPWSLIPSVTAIEIAENWQLWLALGGVGWLLILLVLGGKTAIGLRWRALGTDPAGLTRLGVDTLSMVRYLAGLGVASALLAAGVSAGAMTVEPFGHWAIAGLAILLLGGRPGPILIVIATTVTFGQILAEQTDFGAPMAVAATAMAILLLLARRWREPDQILHVD